MERSRIDKYIKNKEALPSVTRESLTALQLKKLNTVLKREKERGAFYQDLPEALGSLAELSSLPYTTEVRKRDHDLLSLLGALWPGSSDR